ncbi:RDD family protein [Rugamonas rubra]|nr:RDD family protein [Rugamonas rubra]
MSNSSAPVATPTLARRLISMVYETLLGFAVLFLPFLALELALQGSHSKTAEHLRQALFFLVLGTYFIHQWSREGQTLAMRTWRIKVVLAKGGPLSLQAATVRYLLSWMWVLPALLLAYALDLHKWQALGAVGVGVLVWAATALLDRDRQFLHDKLTGTRLVQLPKPPKKSKTAAAA